jgi:hypothetical protein
LSAAPVPEIETARGSFELKSVGFARVRPARA